MLLAGAALVVAVVSLMAQVFHMRRDPNVPEIGDSHEPVLHVWPGGEMLVEVPTSFSSAAAAHIRAAAEEAQKEWRSGKAIGFQGRINLIETPLRVSRK